MNNTKKLVIIAQVFISGIMALLMSLVHMGFTLDWLWIWSTTFVVAWPVAFVLSMFVGPVSFKMATYVLTRFSPS